MIPVTAWSREGELFRLKFRIETEVDEALIKKLNSIWLHLQKHYNAKDDKIYLYAHGAIERMLNKGVIDIRNIPVLVYKRFTIKEYDPLKDDELRGNELEPIPEVYKQIDDLQPKHLTKQGSCYFIQNAWFQRLLSSLDVEHDILAQQLLFDTSSWFQGTTRIMKTNPFSLNIHHNKIASGSGRYKKYREEWIISVERYDEFKSFMSSRKPKSDTKSSHQGCYLIQLNCDEGTSKYKIGKSGNLIERLKSDQYRNAFIYLVCYVSDEDECENEIIREFSSHFTQILKDDNGNYGRETFSGSIDEMMNLFYEICSKYR